MSTNVPMPTLGPAGFTLPEESAVLVGVIADIQAAFGGTLNLSATVPSSLTTSQGQMATTLTAIIMDCFTQLLQLFSQVDPRYAQGRMQDAIGQIFNLTRIPASSTTVEAPCLGLSGVVIPANIPVAQDAAGNLYTCSGATIPGGGSVVVTFANAATGPIAFVAPLTIYQTTPGWDAIGTATLLGLGQVVESQQDFEARRQASLSVNGSGNVAAIRGAVLASGAALMPPQIPTDCLVLENATGNSFTEGGITLLPHSIFVAVAGGNPAAIGAAIWSKKDTGSSYTPSANFTGSISGTVLTATLITSGVLAVGQTVSGFGIAAGITIASLGTGTGGVGTYNLSSSPGTIVGESMTAAWVVMVADPSYQTNAPEYAVSYTVPTQTPLNIQVVLAAASNPPSNALALLQDPVTGLNMAFLGTDGLPSISKIGQPVFASRFFPTVGLVLPGISIASVQIGTGAPASNVQPFGANQIPVIGTITVGYA